MIDISIVPMCVYDAYRLVSTFHLKQNTVNIVPLFSAITMSIFNFNEIDTNQSISFQTHLSSFLSRVLLH